MESKVIFGINMSHDTACAAIIDGEVKVAIEEERLNGVKHCDGRSPYGRIIPYLSINYCLSYLGITADQVDLWVVNSVSPHIIEAFKLQLIGVPKEKIIDLPVPGHHLAHAYSAFHPSGFEEAAILVLDVNGGLHGPNNTKKENYSIYHGKGLDITPVKLDSLSHGELNVPELYTIFGTILQLSPSEKGDYGKDDAQRSGGKLMGYAAQYFNDELKKKVGIVDKLLKRQVDEEFYLEYDKVVDTKDNRFVVTIDKMIKYLKYKGKVNYVEHNFEPDKYFGWSLHKHVHWNYRDTSLKDHENAKFAYEGQMFLEETIVKMANVAYELTGCKNICLAGGSMLNVVACNRILKETPFKNMFVQPAAYDGGNAIGCGLWGYYRYFNGEQTPYTHKTYTSYLGMQYPQQDIEDAINNYVWGLPFTKEKFEDMDAQIDKLVSFLSNEEVICIFRGPSEFGPRALGNRSFLANPNKAEMLEYMNEIKGREWYRPVAPIVLEEALHEYFDAPFDKAPFMTINAHCKEHTKKLIPSVCHVDGSARVQTVSEKYNPFMTKLLRRFAEVTGLPPVLINTSFNIGGPIVELPAEAINTFLRANYMVKALSLEDYILELPYAEQDKV